MTDKSEPQVQNVLGDAPYRAARGWSGLTTDKSEKIAFGGVAAALAALVAVTLLFGLPGLLITFLGLTLVCFAVILVISVGN